MKEKIYSADELIKRQPKVFDELEFHIDEDEHRTISTINVNGVRIHADEYDICYIGKMVMIRFFKDGELIATTSVTGSTKRGRFEHKDNVLMVSEYDGIISETSLEIAKNKLNKAMEQI